jgi:hypothetical protein
MHTGNAKGVTTAVYGGDIMRVMDIGQHKRQVFLPQGEHTPDFGFAFGGEGATFFLQGSPVTMVDAHRRHAGMRPGDEKDA